MKARKVKMSQVFESDGTVIPVTLLTLIKESLKEEDSLEPGAKVKISGISKGKGFQGVVKRWGFKGAASKTHGTKHTERAPGSIGSAFPQKVFRGKKMAGRMGGNRITIRNLKVVSFDKKKGELILGGAVPGRKGTEIEIHAN
jgi:large subunit ribosomal protein L3